MPTCYTEVHDPIAGVTKYIPDYACLAGLSGEDGTGPPPPPPPPPTQNYYVPPGSSGSGTTHYDDINNGQYSAGAYQNNLILGNPSLSAYYQNKQVYDNAIKGFTAINPLAGNTLQKLAIQEQAMQEFALAQLEGRTLEAILGVPGAKGLYFTKQQLEGLSPTLTGSALLDKFAFPSDVQLAQGSDLGVEELDAAAEVPGGFSPLAIGLGVAALGLLLLVSKKRRK